MNDDEAVRALIDCGNKIYSRGLVAANDGNISVRVGENALWITPTGVSKGGMTPDMMVKTDLDGNIISGSRRASTEIYMHLRIYKEDPLARAVVHAHPPASTAFACAGIPLDRPILQEAVVLLGDVPIAPFALPGTADVGNSIAPYCKNHRAVLLEYHGAVVWGDSLQEAYFRLECLEQLANVSLHMHTLNSTRTIPDNLVEQLLALRPSRGIR